jgi:hypothetical protein
MSTYRFALLFPIPILCALLCCATPASGQDRSGRLAILPLSSNGVDAVTIETASMLLRTEIGKLSSMDVVSGRKTQEAVGQTPCSEAECALAIGKALEATQVLGCRLSALGEKIIVQYFLVDVPSGREILIDQATASGAEDLDVLMKRLAKAVIEREPVSKTAEVGQILASETVEPSRRATRKNFGFSFGYLYPQSGYDHGDRAFIVDSRFDYELEDYAVGMLVGIRKGFAAGLYGSYLTSRTDICPYVGGGLGFHWIDHGSVYDQVTHQNVEGRGDGFELSAHAGLRVLHTYSFQMIFNLELLYTMNDFNDRAIVFTLGIL